MPPIRVTTEVDRPAEDVYHYATDPSRFPEWQKGVISGHMEPAAEGSGDGERCVTVRRIGFADRPSSARVVEDDPPRSWRARGVDGPIRALVDVAVAPLSDERARLTIAVDFEGRGIGRLLVPLVVRREARKEMPANIAVLKQRLESQE